MQDKQMISYEEVVRFLKSRCVLFIEGRPGCGKTTFVHKIAQDWAVSWNGSSMGGIRLIFLISLRLFNHFNKPSIDLSDILSLFKDLKVSEELLEGRKGKGVCFIFDGLDELSSRDGVYQIINKTYLNESTVIIASHPAAVAELKRKTDKAVVFQAHK